MTCNESASKSVIRVAHGLFDQAKAFGQLGLGLNTTNNLLELSIPRLAFTRSLLKLLEEGCGLRFADNEFPLCYNTLPSWPLTAEPAGFSTRNGSVLPSNAFDTLLGNWTAETTGKSAFIRTLKCTLWVCHANGLREAIRYLADLQHNGYILNPRTVAEVLVALSHSSSQCSSEYDVPGVYFDGLIPKNACDWTQSQIKPSLGMDIPKNSIVIEYFLEECLSRSEEVRACRNYDEWIKGQWEIAALTLEWFHLTRGDRVSLSEALSGVNHQFTELSADAHGMQRVFCSDIISTPRSFQFSDMMLGAILMIRQVAPDDWRERVVNERVLVPRQLSKLLLCENGLAAFDLMDLPPEWRALSCEMAPMFSIIVNKQELWPHWSIGRSKEPKEPAASLIAEACEDQIKSMVNRVHLLNTRGDYGESADLLKRMCDVFPWSDVLSSELAIALDLSGNPEAALSYIEKAIIIRPENELYWQSLGAILVSLGFEVEAILTKAIRVMIQNAKRQRLRE